MVLFIKQIKQDRAKLQEISWTFGQQNRARAFSFKPTFTNKREAACVRHVIHAESMNYRRSALPSNMPGANKHKDFGTFLSLGKEHVSKKCAHLSY